MNCSMPGFPVFTISRSLLKFMSTESVMLSNHLILCHLLLLLPSIFCSIRVFSNQWIASLHQVANGLDLNLQHQYFQWIFRDDFLSDWLIWSTFCQRDSQESSLAPKSKGINSSVLSLLYGPTLTSIHDYWKKSQLWLHRPLLAKWCLLLLMPGLCLS